MKMVKTTLSVSLLSFLVVSCGNDNIRSGFKTFDSNSQTVSSNLSFQNLNSSVAGNIMASGTVRLSGGKLLMDIESDGHAPSSTHLQFVFSRNGCPQDSDDTNADGIIDYTEAVGESSAVLALTNDLTENGEFPTADESGKYQYQVNLESTQDKASLDGRALIIHGISETVTLPETVQGGSGLSPQESLPIACAVISFEEDQDQTTGSTTGDSTTGDTTTGDSSTTGTTGDKGGYHDDKGEVPSSGKGGKGGQHQQEPQQHQQNPQQQQQQQQQEFSWSGGDDISGETTGL